MPEQNRVEYRTKIKQCRKPSASSDCGFHPLMEQIMDCAKLQIGCFSKIRLLAKFYQVWVQPAFDPLIAGALSKSPKGSSEELPFERIFEYD